jgi:hypothetical protein
VSVVLITVLEEEEEDKVEEEEGTLRDVDSTGVPAASLSCGARPRLLFSELDARASSKRASTSMPPPSATLWLFERSSLGPGWASSS